MPTVQDVLDALESVAPRRFAFPWDKIGLQVGNRETEVERAVVSLDRSTGAVFHAVENDAQLLLTHHPLIFDPLNTVTSDTLEGKTIQSLIFYGVSHVAAHTNWDAAPGGINDTLSETLGLQKVISFGSSNKGERYKLVFFAPEDAIDAVVDACASSGAGQIGNYARCAFCHSGVGTYEPQDGANPSIGQIGQREVVDEIRVEMVCPGHLKSAVEAALKEAHPYEEPAYDFIPLGSVDEQKMGRIGELPQPMSLRELVALVDRKLETKSWPWGNPSIPIERVAIVGGAADGEWRAAQAAGAQVLLTGEVKQHVAVEASEAGFRIIAAGHYATEHPGCITLAKIMGGLIPEVEWMVFEPEPGHFGRPF